MLQGALIFELRDPTKSGKPRSSISGRKARKLHSRKVLACERTSLVRHDTDCTALLLSARASSPSAEQYSEPFILLLDPV